MNSGFSSILLEEIKSEVDKDIASKKEQITSENKGQATSENKDNKAPKETIIKCGKCMIVSQTFPDRKKIIQSSNLPLQAIVSFTLQS